MKKIAFFLIIFLTLTILPGSCSDEDYSPTEQTERGTVSVTLQSGDMVLQTRAEETDTVKDPECYMGTTYLFFYTDTTQTSVYSRTLDIDSYNAKKIHWTLNDDEVATLFPDTVTRCYMYVVTNVPTGSITKDTSYTLSQLKAITLSSDFSQTLSNGDFAMDGEGLLILTRKTMTMAADITLKRALVKIALEPHVAKSIEVKEGNETVTYEPVFTTINGANVLVSTFYNSVTNGVLNGTVASSNRTYTNLSTSYSSVTASGESAYTVFGQQPFYSYPQDWESKYDDRQPSIRLEVAWKKTGESTYTTYYYLLPVSDKGNLLERNHFYYIRMTIGMLGSTDPNTPLKLTDCDYEIRDWGKSSNGTVKTSINDFHFLVSEENTFTIWNGDGVTFAFNSCYELKGVYLTSVSYESTKYPNDDGSVRTVYLYNTVYDEKTHSYSEASYNDYDEQVRSDNSTVVQNLEALLSDSRNNIVSYTTERDLDGVPTGNGTVTLYAPINQTAAMVYRPITYTLVLMNSEAHNYLRQTVKITQYPAKYIEYGPSDNSFVNGYYARVEGKGTYLLSGSSNLYQAYFFYMSSIRPYVRISNNAEYTGTYAGLVGDPYGYWKDLESPTYGGEEWADYKDLIINYRAVSTGYEYLYGFPNEKLTQKNTTDVHVSAFTSKDNTFTINGKTYDYRLGDPRTSSGFTAQIHSNEGTYIYTGTMLYDYYVKGASFGLSYLRYVKSWGDKASKIKIGGESSEYDNVIAPIYKITSSYGALISTTYFKVAQKRCATFQEAGYPAGRWRLPTLAEIAFIARLQKAGVINELFLTSDTGYWTSSGGKIAITNDGITYTPEYASQSSSNACYARCVYDLWYWQDGDNDAQQHLPVNEYHPYPTKQ